MTMKSDAENDLIAELYAAEVARCLGVIAKAEHRISVALCSQQRSDVLKHLAALGISEAAAKAFTAEPLTREQVERITELMKAIEGWRPHLADKIRALAVANKGA